ncbi:hypothetical protein Rs2_34775 [Raphanus sativus]|nr:hypothetical protein Rs2_34775 [Raphanus sativus]
MLQETDEIAAVKRKRTQETLHILQQAYRCMCSARANFVDAILSFCSPKSHIYVTMGRRRLPSWYRYKRCVKTSGLTGFCQVYHKQFILFIYGVQEEVSIRAGDQHQKRIWILT